MRTVDWYHKMLCHPGETRTEHTIRQHFDWRGLRTTVQGECKKCPTCQRAKTDLIGPYTIFQKGKNPLKLWCLTMIDPATGWFIMAQIPNKPYTIPRKGKNPLKLWCLTMIDPVTGWFDMAQIPNKCLLAA